MQQQQQQQQQQQPQVQILHLQAYLNRRRFFGNRRHAPTPSPNGRWHHQAVKWLAAVLD
jgi:transcription initiation factor TFIID subunit TAF12